MKVVVAIDSFKGCMSSLEAGQAVKNGVKRVYPQAEVVVCPVADGGEGTVEAFSYGRKCENVTASVSDPIGRRIEAKYVVFADDSGKKSAFIEMASAAGITLLSQEELNPLETTTYGVGEMIRHAIDNGCRDFIIGIGGSATNDGGVGMLGALGYKFFCTNEDGRRCETKLSGGGLCGLSYISCEDAMKELDECVFTVACDVKNPLCGQNGCSAVYGPQKGASAKDIADMDGWLENYARLTKEYVCDKADPDFPGAGAAGGMGFALKYYLGAKLMPGAELVMKKNGLDKHISECDVVITGEGKLDSQTSMGKVPSGVAGIAKKYGKTVVAFGGSVSEDASGHCNECGIDAFFPILKKPCLLREAMDKNTAVKNLSDTAEQVFRLMRAFGR